MSNGCIVLEREKLYREIWELSLSGVAKKYNLNYSKLVQTCKDNNIPYPTSAYWTKKKMGLDITNDIIKLPESDKKEVELFLNVDTVLVNSKNDSINEKERFIQEFNYLNFLDDEEKNKVATVIFDLSIDKYRNNHKIITSYKNKIKEDRREERKRNYYNPYYNIHNYVESGYYANISKSQKDRCMKILSCIYYAIEELGGEVNNDFSLKIRDELVTIEIEELQDQVKHELTKEEAQRLIKYEDEKKNWPYASKPTIRKYDYVHNGKLKITFGTRNYIKDTDKLKLEDRLGDIIIKLYEKSEEVKIQRLEREERESLQREEKKREEEIRNRKKNEANKVKELVNMAEDYKIAYEIRNYIQAVSSQSELSEEIKEWIIWANKKANWFDPIMDEEDELLGKREHKDSMENKNNRLDKYGNYFSWY